MADDGWAGIDRAQYRTRVGRATIGDQLRRHARTQPDKLAVVAYAPERSEVTYGRLDRSMMLTSPPVAVYSALHGQPQLFSSRIGCEVFRPQDQGLVDLAALCIRGRS